MKKTIILSALIMVLLFTVNAGAVDVNSSYGQKLLKAGYTEDDIMAVNAIIALTDENVPGFVINKYDELGDWQSVCEYYGVDEKKYDNYIDGQNRIKKEYEEIPKYIFDEMEQAGWKKPQIADFMNRTRISEIEHEYAWEQCKKGKDIKEIQKEKVELDKKVAKLITDYVWEGADEIKYQNELKNLGFSETEVEKKTEYVKEKYQKVLKKEIRQSGISEKEMEYCRNMGITDVMQMCKMKNISRVNKCTFKEIADNEFNTRQGKQEYVK